MILLIFSYVAYVILRVWRMCVCVHVCMFECVYHMRVVYVCKGVDKKIKENFDQCAADRGYQPRNVMLCKKRENINNKKI